MTKKTWRELCEAIMREKDPQRLQMLVEELNETLAERERDLQNAKGDALLNQ